MRWSAALGQRVSWCRMFSSRRRPSLAEQVERALLIPFPNARWGKARSVSTISRRLSRCHYCTRRHYYSIQRAPAPPPPARARACSMVYLAGYRSYVAMLAAAVRSHCSPSGSRGRFCCNCTQRSGSPLWIAALPARARSRTCTCRLHCPGSVCILRSALVRSSRVRGSQYSRRVRRRVWTAT